jgi:hypothetical protein
MVMGEGLRYLIIIVVAAKLVLLGGVLVSWVRQIRRRR